MRPKSDAVNVVTWLPRPSVVIRPSKYSSAAPKLRQQLRVLHGLVVVRVEAAQLHIENLPRHAEACPAADDPRHRLQR